MAIDKKLFDHLECAITKYNLHFSKDDKNKIMMDKAVFLIDYIQYQKCYRKDKVEYGYIRLHSLFLNAYLEKKLHKYKTFLTTQGFIQTSPYKVGKSIGYRISFFDKTGYNNITQKEYMFYEFVSMTYEKYLSNTIEKHDQIMRRKKSVDRTTKHLTKWLNEDNIQIDWKGAFRFIDLNDKLDVEQKKSYSYSINRIRFKGWYYTRSVKDNRLHSNLTNLPSELRKFLSHKGQKLVLLDVKTSQPYMLAGIFNLIIEKRGVELEFLKQGLRSKEARDKFSTVINSIPLSLPDITDFRAYNNLICKGDIYNHIGVSLSKDFAISIKSTKAKGGYIDKVYNHSIGLKVKTHFKDLRSYCKALVLEYMYCSIETSTRRIKQIRGIYPKAVNNFINAFKFCDELNIPKRQGKKKRTKRQKDKITRSKKLFPKFLQQLEAFLVLDIITKELFKSHPNMFMATIHDSIVVPIEYEFEVKSFLQKRLYEIFGVQAEIRSENW